MSSSALETWAPDARTLGAALALPGHGAPATDPAHRIPEAVHARVRTVPAEVSVVVTDWSAASSRRRRR